MTIPLLNRLRAAREKVTPLPWKLDFAKSPVDTAISTEDGQRLLECHHGPDGGPYLPVAENADFILQLVNAFDEIVELLAQNASLKAELEEAHRNLIHAQTNATGWETQAEENAAALQEAREALENRELEWLPFDDAPTDGRKLIVGSIAKFTPYKEPKKQGRKGRWQIRDEYGKWRNIDRTADHYIAGYKPDRRRAREVQGGE